MIICVSKTAEELGKQAAACIAAFLNEAIAKKGRARLILSTGASQFATIDALVQENVHWNKVEMFHLDEYVGLSESHIASFRKYLKERFASKVALKKAWYVNGEGDVQANIAALSAELEKEPVDVGVIGIGENAHIAFNDPPADFTTQASYMVVNLDERCKKQQVGEGWFKTVEDVPQQAITMTVSRILKCGHIVSCVPHAVKAEAVRKTLSGKVSPQIPATILKTHPDWRLFIDSASASQIIEY